MHLLLWINVMLDLIVRFSPRFEEWEGSKNANKYICPMWYSNQHLIGFIFPFAPFPFLKAKRIFFK